MRRFLALCAMVSTHCRLTQISQGIWLPCCGVTGCVTCIIFLVSLAH